MNQTAVLGWGLMFVVIGVCALYWDRDLSVREWRRRKDARPKGNRNWPMIVMRTVALLGILSAGVVLSGGYLQGMLHPIEVLLIVMFLVFGIVLLRCFIWYFTSWVKHIQGLPKVRFKLVHLIGFTGLLGLFLGATRIIVLRDEVAFAWWVFAGGIIAGVMVAALFYIGVENLSFGYGSGKRINRLHELKKDQEIRLPTRSNFSARHVSKTKIASREQRPGNP